MPDPAVTTVEQRPGVVVVRVEQNTIDEHNIHAIRADVTAAGTASPDLPVAVDLANVNFMPSITMAGLIQLAQQFRARKQRLAFVNLQPDVRDSLMLMRLDRVIELPRDISVLIGGLG